MTLLRITVRVTRLNNYWEKLTSRRCFLRQERIKEMLGEDLTESGREFETIGQVLEKARSP